MRAVLVVDDRVDRRARRPERAAGRPVDLVAALGRVAAASGGALQVDLLGWSDVTGAGPFAGRTASVADGSATAVETSAPHVLDAADVVHVLPGLGYHPDSLAELLACIPDRLPVVVSLPDRPPLPRFGGRTRAPSRRWSDRLPRPTATPASAVRRAVHVLTTEPVQTGYVQAGVGGAEVASATSIGPGYDPPALAPAYDVTGPVVFAVTAERETAEAVEVLRAAESLGRSGERPLVVIAGVGDDQGQAARAATFAEASGVRVLMLGRPGARELARWRATATVAVTTDRDPGQPGDLAGLLMAGLPVAAVRNRGNKAVAARSTVGPSWYDAGEPVELVRVLSELLDEAHRRARGRVPAAAGGSAETVGHARVSARSALTLLVQPDEEAAPVPGRQPDRHCLPTWDEVAADVAELYRTAAGIPGVHVGPAPVVTRPLPVPAAPTGSTGPAPTPVHLVR